MKKRKIKNNSKTIKNRNKIIIILAIIFLIIALFFIAVRFTGNIVGQITGPITGNAVSTSLYNCTDSDNGINYFEKGVCEDRKQKYEDTCYGTKGMWEYYCSNDKYSCVMQETACPFGCSDGRCLKKGENVSNQASAVNVDNTNENIINNVNTGETSQKELNKNPYLNTIVVILVIVILIFVGWMLFRKKLLGLRKIL